MSLVNGLGGAFVFSEDPARLARWYAEHLGLVFEEDARCVVFWARDEADTDRRVDTTFAIMTAKKPLPPRFEGAEPEDVYGDQPFMLNFRVHNLDATIAKLEAGGVSVIRREDLSYGNFAWVRDADGNRIELYEPLHGGSFAE